MNILIIDDEITAIQYLRNHIDWQALGIGTIFEAQNIETAKKILLSSAVEILLCDIEMPSGSGIELIEWVNHNHYHSINIFITCHDEFRFAQKAISLGAFSYLLKPVSIPELSGVLEQAILKYKETMFMEQLGQLKTPSAPAHSAISGYPWHTILTASNDNIAELIDTVTPCFTAIHVLTEAPNRFTPALSGPFQEQLHVMIDSFTYDYAAPLLQTENYSCLLIVLKHDALSHEQLDLLCHSIVRKFGEDIPLYCIFRQSLSMTQVRAFYHESLRLVQENIFLSSQVIDLSLFLTQTETIAPAALPDMNSFVVMLLKGDFISMQLLISEWEFKCAVNSAISKSQLAAFRLMYEETLFRLAAEYDIGFGDDDLRDFFAVTPDPLASLHTFHNYLQLLARRIYEKIQSKNTSGSVINKIRKYIQEHYMEDISMEDIAGYIGMNKDYLTRLCKQYDNGNTPLSYLLAYRLEQANKLLAAPDFSISEIAAMTGFNSQSYFCKVYKSQFGISPKEYRKKATPSPHRS